MMNWLENLFELTTNQIDHVEVILVSVRGSAPQEVGAKMIVTSDGLRFGTVGGGKIEAHCIRHAQELLKKKSAAEMATYNLQTDIGMTCGGEVSLFFDTRFFSPWTVAIFGAGHIAQELCRVMQTWSCRVKVYDSRTEWIDKLPTAFNIEKILTDDLASHVIALPSGTLLLSLTQGHAADIPVLEAALKIHKKFSFIGVIGSAVKAQRIRAELQALNISEEALSRLHCPVGLDFGDNTPAEIAISIAAQILMFKPIKNQGALID